jgi:DNA-binding Xre family transcriptional regulator
MRGTPSNDAREAPPTPSLPVKPRAQGSQPARTLAPRFARPKVLMGETDAPKLGKGEAIRAEREAFRAFMTKHRLRPTAWAREAGVAPGEILGFLTGQSRSIAPATLEKLAAVAKVSPGDLLR